MTTLLWTLIAIQIAMAAFDTIYHHELTERLAWRPSQKHELALHAARNFVYVALFIVLGFLELHGVFAMLVIAALAVEVVITLADFVEEDISRKLPATERVNHTLLAINYGAILVLAIPVLVAWAREPTALRVAAHGYWSALMAFAACGAVVFGLRDLLAARRPDAIITPPEDLVTALPARQTVLVTGATGFIGRRLVQALTTAGHQVIVLVRDPAKAASLDPPFRLVTGLSQLPDDTHIDAIVNLAGEPIANGPWTVGKRHRILASRLRMTGNVVRLIKRLDEKPQVLVNGSAIGWYGPQGDEILTESADGRPCFSRQLCADWERAAVQAERFGVRVVRLRIGLVLGTEGGMLANMLTPFEYGLGGPFGSGQQWMSWIERDDLVRLIAHAIVHPALKGPVNATAPEPVRNAAFARELGHALHRPAFLAVPAALLRLLGDLAEELLLGGQRVIPEKALKSGFVFRHANLRSALGAMLGSRTRDAGQGAGQAANLALHLPAPAKK
jgi:uncharacterized protein (TIGR01777 family)